MTMKPHQLLLLLLALLSIANLPTCTLGFQRSPNISLLRAARREAYTGQPGGWRKMNTNGRYAEEVVKTAAKEAQVTSNNNTLQAFYQVCQILTSLDRYGYYYLLVLFVIAYMLFT